MAEREEAATLQAVKAMVNAFAEEAEQLKPGSKLARWDDLPHSTQMAVASGLHGLLAPLATMLESAAS